VQLAEELLSGRETGPLDVVRLSPNCSPGFNAGPPLRDRLAAASWRASENTFDEILGSQGQTVTTLSPEGPHFRSHKCLLPASGR
jgi:hypothetical protein